MSPCIAYPQQQTCNQTIFYVYILTNSLILGPGMILCLRGHLTLYIFIFMTGEGATGIWWIEARGNTKHGIIHGTAPAQRIICPQI